MTPSDTVERAIEYFPLDDFTPASRNPKEHDLDSIRASITTFGFTIPILLDERTNRSIVAGHGRIDALKLMHDRLEAAPNGVREVDGKWYIPAITGWASRDDDHAKAALIADNRLTEKGGWDDRLLAELLEEIQDTSPELLETSGYSQDDLDHLLMSVGTQEAEDEVGKDVPTTVNPRQLPIDAIFTISPWHVGAFIAHEAGLKIGTQSSITGALSNRERWEWRFPLTFIDNEWHDYDHKAHVEFVKAFNPKYCTVRDAMTKQQCAEAGVDYYPLEQIIEWADELNEVAERVMVIPKYDCIDKIPDRFMLGYSVRSSYGATPVPAARFIGRDTHLLGGSWKDQRRYLNILGESCVSLDFNASLNRARFGNFDRADGSTCDLIRTFDIHPSNASVVALALSLGNIGKAIHEITTGSSGAPPEPIPEPATPDELEEDTASHG